MPSTFPGRSVTKRGEAAGPLAAGPPPERLIVHFHTFSGAYLAPGCR
jgi:hypothetical protein